MKANPLACALLVLLAVAVQLPAQQTEADRKLLADIRAKAENGDAQSQLELGSAFNFGTFGVAKDEVEAVKWYRKAAEQNLAVAQLFLGISYAIGEGVAKDEAEAVKWYRKAAVQDYAVAQYNLGACYAIGQGVAKNEAEGVRWLRKAADQNYVAAQINLGVRYAKGYGVPQDLVEAAKWYRKAAEQGDASAQNFLGGCYFNGRGVAKDEVEAVKWYRKAAEQGDTAAQNFLGICYLNGRGVAKDEVEAVKWYRKAAEQGDASAQYFLGGCYFLSHGVPQDLVEAAKWLNLASAQGDENAKKWLPQIEHYMTPEQIAEGKRRADASSRFTLPSHPQTLLLEEADRLAKTPTPAKHSKLTFTADDFKDNKTASSKWQPPEGDEIIKGTKIPRWDDTTPLSTKTPKPIVLPDEITTRNGKVYRGVRLQAKNDFEISISCFDQEGAWQMENIKLVDLPDELQNKLGYDPKKAAEEEARQKEREKLFASPKPTPSEQRWTEYNSTIERMKDQQEKADAAAAAAKQRWEEELKEREIEAKERAAAAAEYQATHPPVIIIQQQQQQQQQGH